MIFLYLTLRFCNEPTIVDRAGGTNGAGRAAALPDFVNFTIDYPTNF